MLYVYLLIAIPDSYLNCKIQTPVYPSQELYASRVHSHVRGLCDTLGLEYGYCCEIYEGWRTSRVTLRNACNRIPTHDQCTLPFETSLATIAHCGEVHPKRWHCFVASLGGVGSKSQIRRIYSPGPLPRVHAQ
jgi:hypothetical protein